jgi:thiazolylpeptide-type bacteriocin precursor
MANQNTNFDFADIDLDNLDVEGLEVVSLKEAMALPETGASSGISSTNSCSSCGSSSCMSMK